MLDELKEKVFYANLKLNEYKLIDLTWGNVSGIDRASGLVVIKPSGVPYESMTKDQMVVVDLLTGKVVEGNLNPSSDLPTHLELYKAFKNIGGVVHTHSKFATAFAQQGLSIPACGTTHADNFYGDIPCTRQMTKEEIENEYEKNTGKVIVESFNKIDYEKIPGVLVASHGVFTWGISPIKAVENALVLERCAEMVYISSSFGKPKKCSQYLLNKHFLRKHGKNAYYGQKNN